MKTPSVLMLCENEQAAQLDRRALRDAGFAPSRLMTSGIEAARLLAGLDDPSPGDVPGLVVCAQKLEDMDGEQFCAIIRSHPLLMGLPILLIVANSTEAEQLRTLGCGASAMLARPFSVQALKETLQKLAAAAGNSEQLVKGREQADTRAFDEALATYGVLLRPDREPEDYFRVGMRCLEEKNWNGAITAYQYALRSAQIKAEAELGMAAAYKGKGDVASCRTWLSRGTETLIRAKRWHLARSAYTRLLRHDPSARNPFLAEAHRLIRERSYEEAANTLMESLEVWADQDPSDRLARLCLNADDPQAMLKALEDGLARQSVISPDLLSGQLREAIGVLQKEREDRQRQQAAERKWRLAREIAARESAPAPATPAPMPVDPVAKNRKAAPEMQVRLFGENQPEDTEMEDETPEIPSASVEPLKPSDGGLLSVIRLTWDLARRSRKKGK